MYIYYVRGSTSNYFQKKKITVMGLFIGKETATNCGEHTKKIIIVCYCEIDSYIYSILLFFLDHYMMCFFHNLTRIFHFEYKIHVNLSVTLQAKLPNKILLPTFQVFHQCLVRNNNNNNGY